jgi:aminopeptidase N
VRRAVAAALGQFRVPEVSAALTKLVEGDPSYLVVSEACRALGRSRQPDAKPLLLARLGQSSWADIVRSGTIDGLAAFRDLELVPTLIEQTRYGTAARGRRAAVLALGRIGTDRKTREQLELLLDDADPHLRADVVDALLLLGQPEAFGKLATQLELEPDPRVQRRLREALRDLGGRDAGATKRLSDDLTALRDRVAVLEAQLTRLDPSNAEVSNQQKGSSTKLKPATTKPGLTKPRVPKARTATGKTKRTATGSTPSSATKTKSVPKPARSKRSPKRGRR